MPVHIFGTGVHIRGWDAEVAVKHGSYWESQSPHRRLFMKPRAGDS
ncbi:hypothetical protein FM038_25390 [Shewanella eurypsychrophilus]|uniref:Uncharacterized protein n=1 Tax=Shewanella eurypsychrophilus TaxID=2593656 RepID=A0ABX8S6Z5_9GAMM|nr:MULTISPECIES: hypothetical protein [Shewanella]QXP44999.1 hypothetical protein FM038_25390 [Shewanella eurypsychrophilus]